MAQESIRAIGATPVSLARSEIYSAAQTKAIDGIEDVYTAYANAQLNEVLKVVSETHHIYLVNVSVCSADWFNSLTAEQQELLIKTGNEAGLYNNELQEAAIDDYKQKMIDAGVEITELTDEQLALWQEAGRSFYDLGDEFGWSENLYETAKAATQKK